MSGFPVTTITAEQVAALEAAVMSGTLDVSWDAGGVRQRVVYQSMDSLLKALAYAKDRMNEQVAALRPVPSALAVFQRD